MNLKTFNEFLKKGIVRPQSPNLARSQALLSESAQKQKFLAVVLKQVSKVHMSPNFIVETCYDILIEVIRAKLFSNGFNAGNSHEAEVSYLRNLGFNEPDVYFMNELRYHRNGIKYYGKLMEMDYAEKVLTFTDKMLPLLLKKV